MKKSSILLLSLVAVLTACNKGSGNNDIFTQVRNRKVSKETKEGVMMRYDDFEIVFSESYTYLYYNKVDGEWVLDGMPYTQLTYYRTVGSFHKEMPSIALYKVLDYDTAEEHDELDFRVATVGGKLQLETENPEYMGKPKDIYNRVYNSLFSWGTSFFCGNAHFLAAYDMYKAYMPQQALNKFAKKFNVVEDEESAPGTLEINDDGSEMLYKQGKAAYEITCCSVRYDSYLLDGYDCDFNIQVADKAYKVVFEYSSEIVSVRYSER